MAEKSFDIMVEEMREEDIDAVYDIECECFSVPWQKDDFLGTLSQKDGYLFVAKDNEGRILGYVGCYHSFDEASITNVAVASQFRRCGVADAMLTGLHKWARAKAVQRIFLEVRVSNEPAINLYKKLGYHELGIRKGFYEFPKEDAYIMCCSDI